MLKMYERVMLGPIRHPENRGLKDLTVREWLAVAPLALLAVLMGLFPQPFLERIEPSSARYISRMTLGPVPVTAQAAAPSANQEGRAGQAPAVQEAQPARPGDLWPMPSRRELQRIDAINRRIGFPPVLRPAPQPGQPQNE